MNEDHGISELLDPRIADLRQALVEFDMASTADPRETNGHREQALARLSEACRRVTQSYQQGGVYRGSAIPR